MANQLTRYATVATVDTADLGYFSPPLGGIGANQAAVFTTANNQVRVIRFVLPFRFTIRRISIAITTGIASSNVGAGIYSADGNTLLLESGAIVSTSTGNKTATITAVILEPGIYWHAVTTNDATVAVLVLNGGGTSFQLLNTGSSTQYGTAANASSSSVLPATLGTVTTASDRNPALVVFAP